MFVATALIITMAAANAKPSLSDYALIPTPQKIEFGKGTVVLTNVSITMPSWEKEWIEAISQFGVKITDSAKFKITGSITQEIPGIVIQSDEAYSLKIGKNGISVTATSSKGIYWALMTLNQLISEGKNKITLPECEITDWPAFSLRGFMMDVGRTYISMDELKREIEIMSKFKLNVFHWHLTENQAWRLESKIFPMINDSINTERQPGKFYTVEEAKELMRWATAHNMLLIPELDMPGHSAAFVRTFKHDMQSPEGMKILKLLIEEACETFDSVPYLHIGTDEVAFTNPNFVPEMVALVRSKGKKAISWNPGWKYNPGEIDMIQMWSYRGKATPGIPAIDSKLHYINHFDTYADMVALFRSNVYGKTKGSPDLAGVEIALWNDRKVTDETSNIAQNSLYPLLLTIAERSWDGGGTEYFDSLGTNMGQPGSEDFKLFQDFERRLLKHKATTLKDFHIPYVKQTNVKWRITDAFPNNGDLTTVFPPETEGIKMSYVYNDSTYGTRETTGAGIYLRHVWGSTVPAFYKNPQPNHTAYAFTQVYSPIDQTVGLQVETQNYSRSESDIPPKPGKWDYRESKIWVNGKELIPPVWTADHTVRDNEIPLGNENIAAREPMQVKLHKGWNQVMLKLPVATFNSPATRLVKWMFTFVFTTPDGKEAAPGLIYSPEAVMQ
ncbi:MAG: beta-N-acetylhexosaminidase [Paramuribaculum sp.]|nr:beta-N-acetylhexosaminidase [Paramuribaculum sp.]